MEGKRREGELDRSLGRLFFAGVVVVAVEARVLIQVESNVTECLCLRVVLVDGENDLCACGSDGGLLVSSPLGFGIGCG